LSGGQRRGEKKKRGRHHLSQKGAPLRRGEKKRREKGEVLIELRQKRKKKKEAAESFVLNEKGIVFLPSKSEGGSGNQLQSRFSVEKKRKERKKEAPFPCESSLNFAKRKGGRG